MAGKLKIGVVISSTREGRIGERVTTFVKNAILKDHEVVVFDPLKEDLPLTQQSLNFMFNPSVVPQNIKDLNERFKALDALVFVCAEYNWSLPPALTNLMDNIPPPTVAWKPCGFVTYSMGRMGGSRAAVQLRIFTGGMGMMAVPTNTSIPLAHETLDASGNTKDNKLNEELYVTLKQVYWAAKALKSYAENNLAPIWASS
ncbi:NAD(P)H-dependent FMN reductase PA1204-like [Mya arenaria]|uniref:NAD(P)H-dependent FMN reductase PA1204-like n=1 Tax=Mya arenaria TaxID=6604 RepID=UPI0022E832E0|nr:NAD(P)H-dependent FMN reductase PA1204-like [Mya arenaria]